MTSSLDSFAKPNFIARIRRAELVAATRTAPHDLMGVHFDAGRRERFGKSVVAYALKRNTVGKILALIRRVVAMISDGLWALVSPGSSGVELFDEAGTSPQVSRRQPRNRRRAENCSSARSSARFRRPCPVA